MREAVSFEDLAAVVIDVWVTRNLLYLLARDADEVLRQAVSFEYLAGVDIDVNHGSSIRFFDILQPTQFSGIRTNASRAFVYQKRLIHDSISHSLVSQSCFLLIGNGKYTIR